MAVPIKIPIEPNLLPNKIDATRLINAQKGFDFTEPIQPISAEKLIHFFSCHTNKN